MEELQKLTLLDCVENVQYELKVTQEIFNRAKTDTMFATQLLEYCINKECFVFDRPMPTYAQRYDSKEFEKENEFPSEAGSSGAATFSDTSSTSFDTSQTKSTAGKSFNKPKATKLSGKERNNKDDNNKGADVKNWSKNEVLLLIEIYKEYQLEFLDANITNGDVWVKIATINETLNQQGLPPIPAEKCKTKWETLKRRYKSLKDSQKTSGNAPMTWPFYDEMEEVFGEQPWVKPLSTAGSNTTNKMDPDVISPPRKRQKTLTNYCEELLAAKKENICILIFFLIKNYLLLLYYKFNLHLILIKIFLI
ncbi:uncharacterized protein LOC123272224 [Cotesia glomerata]|uniref:uncharacterized protein LOC123272224 n=1 Tax=Cotesia glomerata TaxID=32391 RepID=UPI001D034209|nr:uncharacterized protein LOC123272224 [Cotesia glomerata]